MQKIIIIFLFILFWPLKTKADGGFILPEYADQEIYESAQTAVIFHDDNQEELYIKVNHEGASEEFVWVIPTPSLPEVNEAPLELFQELADLTNLEKRDNQPDLYGNAEIIGATDMDGVTVHEQKEVGEYEVSVLSSTDGQNLLQWLQENEYAVKDEMLSILNYYIDQGWYFTVAKIKKEDAQRINNLRERQEKIASIVEDNIDSEEMLSNFLNNYLKSHTVDKFYDDIYYPLAVAIYGKDSYFLEYIIGEKEEIIAEFSKAKKDSESTDIDIFAHGILEQYELLIETASLQPIVLKFATEEIVYPLKISQISSSESQEIVLYVFSDKKVQAENFTESFSASFSAKSLHQQTDIIHRSSYVNIQDLLKNRSREEYVLTKLQATVSIEQMEDVFLTQTVQTACLLEYRVCLDDSIIMRSGNNCEFQECPKGYFVLNPYFYHDSDNQSYTVLNADNSVYYRNIKIQESDVNSFELLKYNMSFDTYSKDKNNVYYKSYPIKGADPSNFKIIKYGYSADSDHVYFIHKIIPQADPGTFNALNNDYSKDKNSVYYQGKKIEEATPVNFKLLEYVFGYAKDSNNIYYRGKKIENADNLSFEVSDAYAKDKNSVYYQGKKIEEAVSANFEFLGHHSDYTKDEKNVYYQGKKIEGADSVSFKTFGLYAPDAYAKDKNSVYYQGKKIEEAVSANFEFLGHHSDYTKDEKNVYYQGKKIEGADSVSLQTSDVYAHDNNHIYCQGQIIQGVDRASLQEINNDYSKDKNNVYYRGKKIENADIWSFEALNAYAKDKNNVYYQGQKLEGANSSSFHVLDYRFDEFQSYAKDKNSVYYQGQKITDADSISFEAINGYVMDKNHRYHEGKIIFSFDEDQIAEDVTDESTENEEDKNDVSIVINVDNYYKKENSIYYQGSKITEADVESFRILEGGYAQDKNYVYKNGKKFNKKNNLKLKNNIKGKIMLRVENSGEAYYIHPQNQEIFYLGRPDDAYKIMREQSMGITNIDLEKFAIGVLGKEKNLNNDTDGDGLSDLLENAIGTDYLNFDTDGDSYIDYQEIVNGYDPKQKNRTLTFNPEFSQKHLGKIFLQTEKNGEAWYINPQDQKRYFLGRQDDAYKIMRDLGLGINENNFEKLIGIK